MARPLDLIDISHHNRVISWDLVPDVPIVHKVNEGTFVDPRFATRMAHIADHTEIFGGYTVLIVSGSSIREQVERYADLMSPWWRAGAFTQLDVEPWKRYPRPVTADEVVEAAEVHDELLGAGRCCIYINPNQLPHQFAELADSGELRRRGLWLPDYSGDGHEQAERRHAIIHQRSSTERHPGFSGGIDANTVLDWAAVRSLAGFDNPTTPPEVPDMTGSTARLWRQRGTQEVWLLGVGAPYNVPREILDSYRAQGMDVVESDYRPLYDDCLRQVGRLRD